MKVWKPIIVKIEATINDGFITFGNITISLNALPPEIKTKEKVYIGIRPENIIPEGNPNYPFNIIKFNSKVHFEENLGSSKNLYFKMAEKEICASVSSNIQTNGEVINFSINPKDLHFFDFETQKPLSKNTIFNLSMD